MGIEVLNESDQSVNEKSSIDVVRYALGRLDMHPAAELSIHIVDLETIEDLYMRRLGLPGPTDVVSFLMDELTPGSGRPDAASPGPAILGDIVLYPEFTAGQAKHAGHPLSHELVLLTVHGILHLLSYDYVAAEEEHQMFSLQNGLLAGRYDDIDRRGVSFSEKPINPNAFPERSNERWSL